MRAFTESIAVNETRLAENARRDFKQSCDFVQPSSAMAPVPRPHRTFPKAPLARYCPSGARSFDAQAGARAHSRFSETALRYCLGFVTHVCLSTEPFGSNLGE